MALLYVHVGPSTAFGSRTASKHRSAIVRPSSIAARSYLVLGRRLAPVRDELAKVEEPLAAVEP